MTNKIFLKKYLERKIKIPSILHIFFFLYFLFRSTDVYLYAIDPHLNVMIDMDTLHK